MFTLGLPRVSPSVAHSGVYSSAAPLKAVPETTSTALKVGVSLGAVAAGQLYSQLAGKSYFPSSFEEFQSTHPSAHHVLGSEEHYRHLGSFSAHADDFSVPAVGDGGRSQYPHMMR